MSSSETPLTSGSHSRVEWSSSESIGVPLPGGSFRLGTRGHSSSFPQSAVLENMDSPARRCGGRSGAG
eukprot:6735112-Prymnesium_polylepis.1